MSVRVDLKNDLLAKITDANPGVPVEKWDGEEAVFNSACAFPSLAVAFAGTEFGEPEEFGDSPLATYARSHVFVVFVCTAHVQSGEDGGERAMTIMENSETGASGQKIAGLGIAEIIGEELVHVHMGRFLYKQTWKIELLESH